MDISGQVQIEILHWNHLGIATTGCSSLDAKRRSLRWLPEASNGIALLVGSESLNQSNQGGAFTFTQWGWRNTVDTKWLSSKIDIWNFQNASLTQQLQRIFHSLRSSSDPAPWGKLWPFCRHTKKPPTELIQFPMPTAIYPSVFANERFRCHWKIKHNYFVSLLIIEILYNNVQYPKILSQMLLLDMRILPKLNIT